MFNATCTPSTGLNNAIRDELNAQIEEYLKTHSGIQKVPGFTEVKPLPKRTTNTHFPTYKKGCITAAEAANILGITVSQFRRRVRMKQLPEFADVARDEGVPVKVWLKNEIDSFIGEEPTIYFTYADIAQLLNTKEWTVRAFLRTNGITSCREMRLASEHSVVRKAHVFSEHATDKIIAQFCGE